MFRVLAASVVGLEIAYPLVHGDTRDIVTVTTVVVFASFSLAHATSTRGTRYACALVSVGGLGLVAEIVGVHTGVPFGRYRYTGGLGSTVADVPVAVGLAWLMFAHPAYVVAARLTPHPLAQAVVATVALASWDVFLDPQMVAAGHWQWAHPSPHLPGVARVPLSNLGGWVLVAAIVTAVLVVAGRRETRTPADGPAVGLWLWTWLSSTLANLAFFDRPAVAGWGFAAMGIVGVPLVRRIAVTR